MRPYGIGASLTYILDPRIIISSSVAVEKKNYAKISDAPKEATNLLLSINPAIILDDNRFTFSLSKEQERAKVNYWSYDKVSLGLRYDRVLPVDVTAFLSFDAKFTNYVGINTPSTDTTARSDKVHNYTMGLTKIFWQSDDKSQNLSLQCTHIFTEAKSNIARSNYTKNVSASVMNYSF